MITISRINKYSFSLALLLASPAFASPQPSDLIDLGKVNQVLAQIAQQAVPENEIIESVSAAFDAQGTDIDQGKAQFALAAKVKTTPWDRQIKSELAVLLKTRSELLAADETKVRTNLEAQAGVRTDAIKLIRFVATRALSLPNPGTGGLDEVTVKKLFALTQELTQVASVDRVFAILLEAKQALLASNLPAEQKQVISDIEIIATLQGFQVRYSKTVEVAGLAFYGLGLTVDSLSISIGLGLSAVQAKAEFDSFRDGIKQALLAIQNETQEAIDQITGLVAGYAEAVQSFLKSGTRQPT